MEHDKTIEQREINKFPEFVGKEFKAHWHPDLSNELYHLDRTALSSTGLKTLLKKSPAHFKALWTKGSDGLEEKEAFRYGSLCHLAILEPEKFKQSFIREPVFQAPTQKGEMSTRSKEALKMKDDWYASLKPDQIVVTEKDYENIQGTIASILNHKKASQVIQGATVELSGYFRDPVTGIKCRIRPDIYHQDKKVLIDFKTTVDASKQIFSNQIDRLLYHVSLIFYGEGIRQITGSEPLYYAFLAVEKEDPWAVSLYWLDKQSIETAKAWYYNGMQIMKNCLEKNKFPAYQADEAEEISLPPWAHSRELPLYQFEEES